MEDYEKFGWAWRKEMMNLPKSRLKEMLLANYSNHSFGEITVECWKTKEQIITQLRAAFIAKNFNEKYPQGSNPKLLDGKKLPEVQYKAEVIRDPEKNYTGVYYTDIDDNHHEIDPKRVIL